MIPLVELWQVIAWSEAVAVGCRLWKREWEWEWDWSWSWSWSTREKLAVEMHVVVVVAVVVVPLVVLVVLVVLWPVAISRGATNKHNKLIKFRKLRSLILFHFKLYTRFENISPGLVCDILVSNRYFLGGVCDLFSIYTHY